MEGHAKNFVEPQLSSIPWPAIALEVHFDKVWNDHGVKNVATCYTQTCVSKPLQSHCQRSPNAC